MSYQLLAPPPTRSNITHDSKVTDGYKKWFANVQNSFQATIVPVNYTSNGNTTNGAILQAPVYQTIAERDSISNPPDGAIIYVKENNKFNFRANGIWEVFP